MDERGIDETPEGKVTIAAISKYFRVMKQNIKRYVKTSEVRQTLL